MSEKNTQTRKLDEVKELIDEHRRKNNKILLIGEKTFIGVDINNKEDIT